MGCRSSRLHGYIWLSFKGLGFRSLVFGVRRSRVYCTQGPGIRV